jgi:hypothetical protein
MTPPCFEACPRISMGRGYYEKPQKDMEPGFPVSEFSPDKVATDRAIIMMPMMFVQTKVNVPKNGATSRDAQSSTAMIHIPEKKASA